MFVFLMKLGLAESFVVKVFLNIFRLDLQSSSIRGQARKMDVKKVI